MNKNASNYSEKAFLLSMKKPSFKSRSGDTMGGVENGIDPIGAIAWEYLTS